MTDTNEALDRLYDVSLAEFTPARDQLVAELREQGSRDTAAQVKNLRRPTLPAWVVNQLVRRHERELKGLLSVGDEVRAAQRAALSGRGTEKVREITVRRRRSIDRLLGLAEGLLAQGGHAAGRSTLDKVGETLMAATVDEEAAEAVRVGRLARELAAPSGFEALEGEIPVPAIASKQDQRARERVKRAEEQAREAEDKAKEADREASRLEKQAEQTQRDAERARRRADAAAERARELSLKVKDTSQRTKR